MPVDPRNRETLEDVLARAGQSPLGEEDQRALRNLVYIEEEETMILRSIVGRVGADKRLVAYAKKELDEDNDNPSDLQKLKALLP